jgi:hypothetical protein
MHAHARTTRRAPYQQLQNAIVQGGVSSAVVIEPIFEGDASIAFHFAQVVSNAHAGTNVVGVFASTYSCSVGDGVRHTGAAHGEQQLRTANRGGLHIPIVSRHFHPYCSCKLK